MRPDRVIRLATDADANCLAALVTQVWLHTYATQGIRSNIAQYVQEQLTPEMFRRQVAQPNTFVLVAEIGGHLVGYAAAAIGVPCIAPSDATTHLEKLYVQEYFLGQGVGYELLTACQAEAKRRAGDSALWLTVNSENERARAFYERQGFEDIGVTYFDLYGEKHENRILHAHD